MYVEREISGKFDAVEKVYGIVAVVGPRQAGKTTFLKEKGKLLDFSYVTFDDPDVRSLFDKDVKLFETQFLEDDRVAVLDEVQYGTDAGQKLKYLVDKGRKICVTSSSEILLSKEVLSYLVGRVTILRLYPFSLREFLSAKGQREWTEAILQRLVWEHATYGGYPKVVLSEGLEMKRVLLGDLYETMLLKDVARTFSIMDLKSLEELVRRLAFHAGGILSYGSLCADLKLSFQTLKKYLDALEKSYLIIRVSPYFSNRSKELVKQPKVYFVDAGLRNAALRTFPSELDGKTFENYVLTELLKAGYAPKFWRTKAKAEVDFIIEKNGSLVPIEVKLAAEPGKTEASLHSFIQSYAPKQAIVVSFRGQQGHVVEKGCRVDFTDVPGMLDLLK